ncbi:BZ3500_MvSof-1268-A1-R1_Chr3-1g06088 [Microbotryum saponariae]|uniref:BZ3500_MvSof-1268-A1-R1_Chr3-1g06088 protein n=1 Tax=Microbotryum saponariae TaxID=289078 RepID=A0A2X0L289_9BASI|nr:BZ3500_MvSof-1268-A1-R1_Chr3-1g06088 [Microbotryum saponariae]SDA03942.1 BZ3501_MvSof-1269-A2-R1_Chr3-2g05773 [Microbotryum saponariae]
MSTKTDPSGASVYRCSLELEPSYRVEIQKIGSTISTSILLHDQIPKLQAQATNDSEFHPGQIEASSGIMSVVMLPAPGNSVQQSHEFNLVKALVLVLWPHFACRCPIPEELEVIPTPPNPTLLAEFDQIESRTFQGGVRKSSGNGTFISRGAVFQLFKYACTSNQGAPLFPYVVAETAGTVHPLRPTKPVPSSTIYSRHIPHLEQFFSLHVAGPSDLDTLHVNFEAWLNDERVDVFWQEKGSFEQHRKFLADRTSDAHVLPVIGSYLPDTTPEGHVNTSKEPATYSEIYWVKEDRLGSLMEGVQGYDRGQHAFDLSEHTLHCPDRPPSCSPGLHMLVGSNAHRGPRRIRAWMPSLVHYCFLDEPRTQRVVCEPNEKNVKILQVGLVRHIAHTIVIPLLMYTWSPLNPVPAFLKSQYLESVGFERHGSVAFPHKTAALMIVDRVRFYELFPF